MYNIESISTKLIEYIADVLDELEIRYVVYDNRVSFACPVHNGDNPEGSSIFTKGIGNWQCFTHQCHSNYGTNSGASIIQFVQAVINVDFFTALQWCAKFVGEEQESTSNTVDINKLNFIQLCDALKFKSPQFQTIQNREQLRSMLTIPSKYYIKRGYSREILDKFDIGYCYRETHAMFNRVVSPLFDDSGQFVVGYIGRNIYEKCEECGYCHKEKVRCPITKDEIITCVKWKCNHKFSSDDYLYNYWNAKPHIIRTNTVVLVEGPGDVWRLEEAGIYNSVAVLGTKFSKAQRIALEKISTVNIFTAFDNDDAGNKIAKKIYEDCRHMFNIFRFVPQKKDVGDMSIEDLKIALCPKLDKIGK